MKKTLSILFSILSLTLMAQVPQGVDYQAVATDINGDELVNQSISIRASVLSGSATGTIEWEETHATSTDTFGLFTLTIGQGTNTTNGAQTSFADISWGTNTHFLKIEMDVTGGSNYSFMGTNQMMSVPYALYAESANINYDSISNLLSNDSTFITNVGGGIGGDGCDFLYPDGFDGDGVTTSIYQTNTYTVPLGKRLYILSHTGNSSPLIDGIDPGLNSNSVKSNPAIINSGQVISNSNTSQYLYFNGFLVDENPSIEAISMELNGSSSYTVPTGKRLYVLVSEGSAIIVDGVITYSNYDKPVPTILNSGQVLTSSNNIKFNGYLADENYFAGCGGGGGSSSSTSSLDSTTIANMIAGAGGGCNYSFPDGLNGDAIAWNLSNSNYTVPAGKNLYITNVHTNDGYSFRVDGKKIIDEEWGTGNNWTKMLKLPICAKAGEVISASTNSTYTETFYGILTDAVVDPIIFEFDNPGTGFDTYTVPAGKKLYITNVWAYGGGNYNSELTIDGVKIGQEPFNKPSQSSSKTLEIPLIVNSGSVVSIPDNYASFNGYLADENYFAGCGGGGGSSSSTSSLDSTTIANMIANSGGNMAFGEFEDITSQINNNLTNTTPHPVFQQNEDGFIYIYLNPGSNWFNLSVDSVSPLGFNFMNMYGSNKQYYQDALGVTPIIFPIKKDYFWSFSAHPSVSVWKAFWIPLESGGGSSSASSNSIGDFSYPDGKDNMTPIIHDLSASTYTVPAGKNLYITSYKGMNSFDELQISSNTVFKGRGNYSNGQGAPVGLFELPIIVASSQIVDAPGNINGFLVDESITPVTFSLSGNYVNNITYTVPAGKILVVLNFYSAMNGGYGGFQANGIEQLMGIFNYYDNISGCSPPCHTTCIKNPMFFDENTIISAQGWHDLQIINGYLMDK